MIFNTHERTPKIKTNKTVKILLIIEASLLISFFLFAAIVTSVISKSIKPALIILIPLILLAAFMVITTIDMNKAYIKINEHNIIVVDYYFLRKKERIILMNEIYKAEIRHGSSVRIHGYRYNHMGFSYIVFRNEKNKYLFKVINCPETIEYFSKYFAIESF